jgi:hypothetical protein
MTSMHANSMRTNVAVNDNVVAGRMGIGSQLAVVPPAILSPGLPASAGTEPTTVTRCASTLVDIDYCDASRRRAGRSDVSPAGGFALHRPGHARTTIGRRWSLAKQQGFNPKPLFLASMKRETSARQGS